MSEFQPDQELRSWKEIAAYLKKSIRTVQGWEAKLGLPVRRLAAGGKDEIVVTKAELDQWNRQRLKNPASETGVTPTKPTGLFNRWSYVALIPGLILATAISVGMWAIRSVPPRSVRFDDGSLLALDLHGKEMWRFPFPARAQDDMYSQSGLRRLSWIGDIDGDGQQEILFVYRSLDSMAKGTPLYCFSQEGKVKWTYAAGRPLITEHGERFSGIYYSSINADSKYGQVIVRSNHSIEYPHQISMLDSAGRLLGEHWHPGHIYLTAVSDVDQDGKEDLLFAGVNNEAGQATLVVLDREELSKAGALPDGTLDQLCRASKKLQKRTVFFPRSCITQKFHKYNRVYTLIADDNGITVHVSQTFKDEGEYVVYNLSPDLQVANMTVADSFLSRHKDLEAEGKLDHSFSQREYDDLRRIVVSTR